MKLFKTVAATAFLASSFAHADFKQKPLTVNFLHMNDHHSHITADDFDYDVSALGLTTTKLDGTLIDEVEVTYGGFPMLVDIFGRLENKLKNPVKIHAGDAITGTAYYSLFKGASDAAMMNQICFDMFALGNHEFDDGDTGLANFLDQLNSSEYCHTPVLAANVVPGPTSAIFKGYIQPYTIKKIEGQKVGFIGIDVAGKTKNSSNPDDDTQFLDEVATAQYYIDKLRAKGINKIVLVTHYQYANDIAMASQLSGVDVIIGGDSHTLLGSELLSNLGFPVSGEYPTVVTDADGNKVCIAHAWEYAHALGRLKVRFDKNGKVKQCKGSPILPISNQFVYEDSDGEDKVLGGADKRLVRKSLTAGNPEFRRAKEDAETVALLEGFNEQIAVLEQTVIGTIGEDLCLERWPGQGRSTICDVSATYTNGSDISNLVAKAFMTVTPTADFAIQNGGGVRVDVPAGDYTIADVFTLLPFSNTLVTLEMTGQEIVTVLEDALANTLDGGSSGSYPYASGIRFDVDASQTEGSRISNVEINPRVAGAWTAIDLAATYTVVTNDFIASGRDGYDTFGVIFGAGNFVDTFTEYAQGFINYVESETAVGNTIDKLPLDEYSTQSYIGTDGCAHNTDPATDGCVGF